MFNSGIETLPLPKLRELQNERLRHTMARVSNVPFYKTMFQKAGVAPSDIKGVEDLPRLPFTRKDDLRANYPFGLFAVDMDKIRRIHASSGTTGKPTVVGYTGGDLEIFDEVVARSLACAGATRGMRLHNAYGYGLFTGGLGLHGGATRLGMAVVPVSGGMTDRQLMLLEDFQPEVICCTPSYALALGEEIEQRGLQSELNLKYAVLGAEPWTESVRKRIEDLMGVVATNIYGLSEIIGPGVSQEDYEEQGTGSYVWEDHFFPEVVDRDSGEPLDYGKDGVLVFTTLTKEGMPLLRYWTNDICSLYYDSDGKRTHIKMSPIKGRADDMLIIRGVNLFHTQVEVLLQDFMELTPNYQLVVTRKKNLDYVQLRVEKGKLTSPKKGDSTKSLAARLGKKIKDNIGLTMEVELEKPGAIPRSEGGKLNRIVDHRNRP